MVDLPPSQLALLGPAWGTSTATRLARTDWASSTRKARPMFIWSVVSSTTLVAPTQRIGLLASVFRGMLPSSRWRPVFSQQVWPTQASSGRQATCFLSVASVTSWRHPGEEARISFATRPVAGRQSIRMGGSSKARTSFTTGRCFASFRGTSAHAGLTSVACLSDSTRRRSTGS